MGRPHPSVAQAALLLALAACGRVAAEDREGDVLLVTIDTLRSDFVSAYGAPFETTPHLDALAEQGVLLADHHATISLTAPSHLSMFTGLLPSEHGLRRNGPRFPDDLTYLPEVLARAGYRTGAFLGASIMQRKAGFARGFEVFDDDFGEENHYAATQYRRRGAEVVDRALAFLGDTDERPTFLWVHLYDAHDPFDPETAIEAVDEAEARAAFAAQVEPSELVDAEQQIRRRREYEAEVRYTDAQLGRLLEAWDRNGRGRRGLVVVTSDHGEGLGEHDYVGHGFYVYQEQLLVPLVARMRDRLPAGRRVTAQTTALDLPRTLTELVGVDGAGLAGRSMAALWSGEADDVRPALLAERREWGQDDVDSRKDLARLVSARAGKPGDHYGEQIVLVRSPWKFIWNSEGGPELYQLERDPAELDNRAASEPELVERFTAEVEAWSTSLEARSVDGELDEETLRMLNSLGY